MTDPARPKTRRRRRRYLLAACALAAVALAVAGKHLLLPAYVRYRIQRALPAYWSGTGEIGEVEVNFLRASHLRDVRLRDERGRTWLTFDDAALTLRDVLTIDPVVVGARFARPAVSLHVDQGRVRPPLADVPALIRWFREATQIRRLAIEEGSLALALEAGDVAVDRIVVLSERRAGRYHISVRRLAPDGTANLLAEGAFNVGDAMGSLHARVHLPLSEPVSAWLSEATRLGALELTGGHLDANVTFHGRWTHPLTWRPEGTVRADGLALAAAGVPFAEGLDAVAVLGGQGAPRVRTDLSARRFCGGSGRATVDLALVESAREWLAPHTLAISGEGAGVDLSTLLGSAGRLWGLPVLASIEPNLPLGRLDASLSYNGGWREDGSLGGRGDVRFEGLRLLSLPLLGEHVAGLLNAVIPERLTLASGSAAIVHGGTDLLIRQGRLASPLLTVELDPNARIDLSGGTVALQATARPTLTDADGPLARFLAASAGARRLLIHGSLADANGLRARLTPRLRNGPGDEPGDRERQAEPPDGDRADRRRPGELLDRLGRWWDRLGLPPLDPARRARPDANEGT